MTQRPSEYLSDAFTTNQLRLPRQNSRVREGRRERKVYLKTVVPINMSEVMFNIILKYMLESKTSYISSIACRLGSQLDPIIFSKSLVATYENLTTHKL